MLPLFVIMFIVNYIDRVNIGFVRSHMEHDLGIGAAAYGFGAGLFFIGYALFEVPSNMLLQKVGARIWLTRIMFTWGITATLMAFIQNETHFYILRFLLGVAEAGFFPGVIYYFTRWLPGAERGKAIAIFLSGSALASLISGPLSGLLLQITGMGLHGWQWMFIIMGVPCVPYAFVVWKYLPDRPTKAPWLDKKTAQALEDYIEAENAAGAAASGNHDFRAVLKDRQILLAVLAYMTNQLGVYTVVYFLPSIIAAGGPQLTSLQVGLLISFPWILASIGAVVMPRAAERQNKPKQWMWIATFGMFVGLLIAVLGTPWVAYVGYCIVCLCFVAPQPLYFAHVGSRLQGAMLAAGLAAVNTFGLFGGFLGPTVMGQLQQMTGSTKAGLWFVIAVQIIGLVLIACLRSSSGSKKDEVKMAPVGEAT